MGFCANFLILLSCRMDTGVSETFTGRYVTTAARPGTLPQSHDGYRRQRVSPYTGAARLSAGRPSQQCRTRPDGSDRRGGAPERGDWQCGVSAVPREEGRAATSLYRLSRGRGPKRALRKGLQTETDKPRCRQKRDHYSSTTYVERVRVSSFCWKNIFFTQNHQTLIF